MSRKLYLQEKTTEPGVTRTEVTETESRIVRTSGAVVRPRGASQYLGAKVQVPCGATGKAADLIGCQVAVSHRAADSVSQCGGEGGLYM